MSVGYGCCRFCGDTLPWADDIPDVCMRCDQQMRDAVEEDERALDDERAAERILSDRLKEAEEK